MRYLRVVSALAFQAWHPSEVKRKQNKQTKPTAGFFDWVVKSRSCHLATSDTKCLTCTMGSPGVGRGPEICERILSECPQKAVNLPNQGRGVESGSTPHIHSNKQEGTHGRFLELQVRLHLHSEAGGTMTWWREAGAKGICPAPRPPQLKLLPEPNLPPPLESSPSPWQPSFGPRACCSRRCHRPLQDQDHTYYSASPGELREVMLKKL